MAWGLAALLALSACAEQGAGGSGDPDSGDGVAFGATKAEYIDALAGMEPVTVQLQSLAAPDTPNSRSIEDYAAALEEWSGGKLQPEVAYSGSIAPAPEAGDALADGRVDIGTYVPIYEPEEFPVYTALAELTFSGQHTPLIGRLQLLAAYGETAWDNTDLIAEQDEAGLQPMLPIFRASPMVVLLCKDGPAATLPDMNGLKARGSGRTHATQLESLGITPVSLDITEIYQGLQRGVVDCGAMNLTTANIAGALGVGKHVTFSPQVGFAAGPGAWGVGKRFWEDLPLAARQLIWDRLDVVVEADVRGGIENEIEAIETIRDNNGSIEQWEDDVVDALRGSNQQTLNSARDERPELIDELSANVEKWNAIITEDLGYEEGGSFDELPAWYSTESIDLEPFVSRFVEKVLKPHRPTATS